VELVAQQQVHNNRLFIKSGARLLSFALFLFLV